MKKYLNERNKKLLRKFGRKIIIRYDKDNAPTMTIGSHIPFSIWLSAYRNINFTNNWINMEKESTSISDKLMGMMAQLYDFVTYEIENTKPNEKKEEIAEQVDIVYSKFEEKFNQIIKLIKDTDLESALFMLNSMEPAFWMHKAYKTIRLIQDPRMEDLSSKGSAEKLVNSILYLCDFITRNCYHNCLIVHDQEIEIREGGVIYTDITGLIAGYSKYIYDNQEVITDDPSSLYLF